MCRSATKSSNEEKVCRSTPPADRKINSYDPQRAKRVKGPIQQGLLRFFDLDGCQIRPQSDLYHLFCEALDAIS
jgi:hypothetical protein